MGGATCGTMIGAWLWEKLKTPPSPPTPPVVSRPDPLVVDLLKKMTQQFPVFEDETLKGLVLAQQTALMREFSRITEKHGSLAIPMSTLENNWPDGVSPSFKAALLSVAGRKTEAS